MHSLIYTIMDLLVQPIGAVFCGNCALGDRSMKLGTQLGLDVGKIFGYRDIADLSRNKNGGYYYNIFAGGVVTTRCYGN
jgi:hypothetical protein